MQFFARKTSLLFILVCLPLIFIPKINLIKFSGQTAGIRLDDMILLSFAVLLFWGHFVLEKRSGHLERLVIAITAFSFFSYFMNRFFVDLGWLHVDAKIFYCVRLLEYFLFFYIGAISIKFFEVSSIVRAFFLWNLVIMILQKFHIVGEFNVEGYSTSSSYRVSGIASFPSEMGALLDIMFCYLIYDGSWKSKIAAVLPFPLRRFLQKSYLYWLFLIFAILVIWTGSRIAILALVVTFLGKLKDEIRLRSLSSLLLAGIFIAVGAGVMFVAISKTMSLMSRSAGLFSFSNLDLIETVWDNIDLSHDPIGNESVEAGDYDMSWWMRIHKWCYALKIYYLHPECYLQGVGPGFAMGGLDGGLLRIFTEYGIVGSVLFFKFFTVIYRESTQLKWMVVAFLINMIFFDVYLAYKVMSMLFLVAGAQMAASSSLQDFEGSAGLKGSLRLPLNPALPLKSCK